VPAPPLDTLPPEPPCEVAMTPSESEHAAITATKNEDTSA